MHGVTLTTTCTLSFTVFNKKHQNTVIMHDTGNFKMGFKLTIMYTVLSIQCVCVCVCVCLRVWVWCECECECEWEWMCECECECKCKFECKYECECDHE